MKVLHGIPRVQGEFLGFHPKRHQGDDFLFVETSRSLHVCNAPSPAATSAIPIGEHLCDKILDKMQHD